MRAARAPRGARADAQNAVDDEVRGRDGLQRAWPVAVFATALAVRPLRVLDDVETRVAHRGETLLVRSAGDEHDVGTHSEVAREVTGSEQRVTAVVPRPDEHDDALSAQPAHLIGDDARHRSGSALHERAARQQLAARLLRLTNPRHRRRPQQVVTVEPPDVLDVVLHRHASSPDGRREATVAPAAVTRSATHRHASAMTTADAMPPS